MRRAGWLGLPRCVQRAITLGEPAWDGLDGARTFLVGNRCFQNGSHNENASNDCTLITSALWYAIFRASAASRSAVHLYIV